MFKGAVYLLGVTLALFFLFKNNPMPSVSEKIGDAHWRMTLWKNTGHMIMKNPFGIGPGNFEYSYLDYNFGPDQKLNSDESFLIESPHNGYLELMAENGWSAVIGLIFLLFSMFRQLIFAKEKNDFWRITAALGIFILIDALFSFPMENAYPFLMVAIVVGLSFNCSHVTRMTISRPLEISGRFGVFLIVSFLISGFFLSRAYEGSNDYSYLNLSCRFFPAYSENCISQAELEIEMALPQQAIKTYENILKRAPNHFPALLGQSLIQLDQGDIKGGCFGLSRYDSFFGGRSSIHSQVHDRCDGKTNNQKSP